MAKAKKKKRFFEVEMPLIKKTTSVLAFTKEELEGKLLTQDITRILKGKNALIQMKIQVKEDKAIAIPRKFQVVSSYLKRIIRKETRNVEDSFVSKCKDGELRIKPLLVTRKKVPRSVRKELRKQSREFLEKYVEKEKIEEIFEDVLKNKLQKELSLKLKKVYPLAVCEIRILKVEKDSEPEKKA